MQKEINRRDFGGEAQESDAVQCSDCGAPETRLCVCALDQEEGVGQHEDAGLVRWDAAVERGAEALLAARDEARKKLDERSRKIAARPMRAPRWNEDAIEEAELEMTAEETAALAACRAATNPDESLACNARFQEVTTEWRKAERAEMRAVLTLLHAVRIPIGAIDCCEVCKAAIATGSSMCATCAGLFEVAPTELVQASAAGMDSGSDIEIETAPAAAAPAPRRSTRVGAQASARRRSPVADDGWLMGDRFDYVDDVAVAEADDDAAAVAEAMSAPG